MIQILFWDKKSLNIIYKTAAAAVFDFGRFEPHKDIGVGMASPLPENVGWVLSR